MKKLLFIAVAALIGAAAISQTDHDNIGRGRPLSFEDAEPIATGAYSLEFGLSANLSRRRALGLQAPFEFVWGAASDTQIDIGTSGFFGSRSERSATRFELEGLNVAFMRSFRREIRNAPALALKAEIMAPTRRGDTATYRLTGIATTRARQYDRLHLNVDLELAPNASSGANRMRVGAVIGYTNPIGYPRRFDTTGLAEVVVRQPVESGGSLITAIGIGLRCQLNPRSVLDFGLQSELSGRDRTALRLIAGYSTSF